MIVCNHCGAKNQDNAKVCMVCGKPIQSKEKYTGVDNTPIPWYKSNWFTILMLIFFFPVGLILMWVNKNFKLVTRIIISAIFGIFFAIGMFAPNTGTSSADTSNTSSAYTMKVSGVTTEELGNIKFKVPSYYDVRVTKDDVYNVYFYPETEDASATLGFILTNKGYSSNDVKNSKEAITNNWKQTFANLTTEELMIGDNYVLKSTGSRDGAKMKGAAVVNNANKETVIVVLSVDDIDKTNNDYFGDFDKMINSVYIPQKAPVVNETTKPSVSNQNNSKTPEKAQETTKTSNYKNSEVGDVINDINNEIDKAKSELNSEIDKAVDELKDEMGLAGELFGGYVDDYADAYKDAVNDFSDIYKDTANEYGKMYDDLLDQFGY